MKKKIFSITLSLCLISALVVCGVYASKNMAFFEWGKQNTEINEISDSTIVAKVNGIGISKSKFDSYKIGLSNASVDFSDEQILDKLIEQEVIMQEINRMGYTVTDSEVNAFNNERFAILDEDPAAYQIVKDYIDGLGITMDDYKEMSKEISRTALLANKYKADLMKEFEKSNSKFSMYSMSKRVEKFEEYFDKKINELSKNAKIEIMK